jgi:hypothetical protein
VCWSLTTAWLLFPSLVILGGAHGQSLLFEGVLEVDGRPYSGSADVKSMITRGRHVAWSNDGNGALGTEPEDSFSVTIDAGRLVIDLGAGSALPIPKDVIDHPIGAALHVWVDIGEGFSKLWDALPLSPPEQVKTIGQGVERHEDVVAAKIASKQARRERGEGKPKNPGEWMRLRQSLRAGPDGRVPVDYLMRAKGHLDAVPVRMPGDGYSADAGLWGWEELGPLNIGGRVRALAIDPEDPDRMWLGSAGGGIWRTTTGGADWDPMSDFIASLAVTSIVLDPTNSDTIFAGTGEGAANPFFGSDPGSGLPGAGVFRSLDGGTSWAQLSETSPSQNSDFQWVNRLAIDPVTPSTLFAATSSGNVYRTLNALDPDPSWTPVLQTVTGALDVKINPQDPQQVLVGTFGLVSQGIFGDVWYSTTGGGSGSWTALAGTGGLPANGGRCEVAFGNWPIQGWISSQFEDIQSSGTAMGLAGADDASLTIPIGFSFGLLGTTVTALRASTNGHASLSGGSEPDNECPIGQGGLSQAIYAYWDDLSLTSHGEMYYETRGTAPNRRFIIQWEDVHRAVGDPAQDHLTFQIKIFEGTDIVEVHYGTMFEANSPQVGGSATLGAEALGGFAYPMQCNAVDSLSFRAWGIDTQEPQTYLFVSMDISEGRVWSSADAGQSWQAECCGNFYLKGQGWYDNAITVLQMPEQPFFGKGLLVLHGGINAWRGGLPAIAGPSQSKTPISDWTQYHNGHSAHADHHIIVPHPQFDGVTNRIVFSGNDGGVQRLDSGLVTQGPAGNFVWTNLANGLGITQFYRGAAAPDGSVIIGGSQDNDSLRYRPGDGPSAWYQAESGDGGYCAVNYDDPSRMYTEYTYLAIERSTNGGASYSPSTPGLADAGETTPPGQEKALFIAPFEMDPTNPDILVAGGTSLWRTTTGASSWLPIRSPLASNSKCSAITVAKQNSSAIWAGYENGTVSRTDGIGVTTWIDVNGNGSFPLPARFVTDIAISPWNSEEVWVSFGGPFHDNVWYTSDNGANWSERSGTGIKATGLNPLYFESTFGLDRIRDAAQRWVLEGFEPGMSITVSNAQSNNGTYTVSAVSPQYLTLDPSDTLSTDANATAQVLGPFGLPLLPTNTITVHPADTDWVYVGLDLGVMASEDNGLTWSQMPLAPGVGHEGPVNTEVSDLFWQGGEKLIAATHGRGMYRASPLSVIYVDLSAAGAATQDGSLENPFATVAAAEAGAIAGDIILIKDGTYVEGAKLISTQQKLRAVGGSVLIK